MVGVAPAMSHAYTSLLTHVLFSTKYRKPLIDAALETQLFPYFGGIVRQRAGKLYAVNGTEDHVHLLIELPPAISLADAVHQLKGGSSHWIRQQRPYFAWQRGYGAFSVSRSQVSRVATYIERQKEHHHVRSLEQELEGLLKCHSLTITDRDLWS